MSMIDHLTSEILFDPIHEFHDQYKLAIQTQYLYGVRQGQILRSELELGAAQAAVTAWLILEEIIREVERDDPDPQVCE